MQNVMESILNHLKLYKYYAPMIDDRYKYISPILIMPPFPIPESYIKDFYKLWNIPFNELEKNRKGTIEGCPVIVVPDEWLLAEND